MEAKKRLGRGLDALLSNTRLQEMVESIPGAVSGTPPAMVVSLPAVPAIMPVPAEVANLTPLPAAGQVAMMVSEIPVDKINRNPHQPRQVFEEGKLRELADSIAANGIIQPITIRAMGGSYQLIAGERRLRAAILAGKTTIPSIIRQANEDEMLEWALVENIQREDLNPIERARAYANYLKSCNLTQEQAAGRLGENRSNLANYIRLLDLEPEIKDLVSQGELSMGHARALLAIKDSKTRLEWAHWAVKNAWPVRYLEERIKDLEGGGKGGGQRKQPIEKHPNILELERELTQSLGTRVSISTVKGNQHKGRVEIEFFSLDDFDRIREKLLH